MADSGQSIDDLIMCLVGMGFEFDDCQQAVQSGKLTVQHAVEWILAGKPQPEAARGQGSTLRLGMPTTSIGANPFSAPQPVNTSLPVDGTSQTAGDDTQVVSRSHLNDEQRKIRDRFEDKQRAEARKQAQEDKLAQKRARELALMQIQEDRERRKMRRSGDGGGSGASGQATGEQKVEAPTSTEAKVPDAQPSDSSQDKKCMIQIRLPNGRALKQSFSSAAQLSEVWQVVTENFKEHQDMCFMQPFPRKEFSAADMESSLSDLGLTPSGSLVLKKMESTAPAAPAQAAGPAESNEEPEPLADDSLSLPSSTPAPLPPVLPGSVRGTASARSHRWGSGHALDSDQKMAEEAELEEGDELVVPMQHIEHDDDSDSDSGEDVVGGGGPPWANPQAGGGGAGGLMQNVMHAFPGAPAQFNHANQGLHWQWGAGQALNAQFPGEQVDQQLHHQKDPKKLAAEAASQRFAVNPEEPKPEPPPPTLHYSVPRLTALIVHDISRRICDTRNPITSLHGLPPEVALHVLNHLIKERLLKNKTLHPFISCHLKKLVLDSYPYVTNELLTAIRLHTSLTQLSLGSCPLITDKGLLVLHSLKRLKHLSLHGCKQLTDQCFELLKQIPSLVSVVLEDTGITDAGVISYATDVSESNNLQNLDLSRTQITSAIIPHLKSFTKLRNLLLETTKLTSLSGIQELKSLESLNIAHTLVVTDSLLCLSNHSNLKRLNISNTELVNGDLALEYLKGLQLQVLQMPSRLTTTGVGIKFISSMPLLELDLTNYVNISPDGFEHIRHIQTLKRLRLGNTKITDASFIFLEGLRKLEELLLDRTIISDVGAAIINGNNFPSLQELSLSGTAITNDFLTSGNLNSCVEVSKLNLSRTHVSDRGLRALRLPYLSLLNIDGTMVGDVLAYQLKELPQTTLDGCPKLGWVTSNNRREPEDNDNEH